MIFEGSNFGLIEAPNLGWDPPFWLGSPSKRAAVTRLAGSRFSVPSPVLTAQIRPGTQTQVENTVDGGSAGIDMKTQPVIHCASTLTYLNQIRPTNNLHLRHTICGTHTRILPTALD